MTDPSPGPWRLPRVGRGAAFAILVDGRPVAAHQGESVAAALLAAGHLAFQHHQGRPLGVFCNIGQCHGCLLTIDGVSGVRACQTPARPGMVVETRRVARGEARP